MIYKHPKSKQTQTVQESEATKIAILERLGWRKVDATKPETETAVTQPEATQMEPAADETPIREVLSSHDPVQRKRNDRK